MIKPLSLNICPKGAIEGTKPAERPYHKKEITESSDVTKKSEKGKKNRKYTQKSHNVK
jgi:hypothetical protein